MREIYTRRGKLKSVAQEVSEMDRDLDILRVGRS